MPAKDLFHNTVKTSLEKDGWTITDENLFIKIDKIEFYIDLVAERILIAEKAGQKIAVEVKSFTGASVVSEFHTALGQFLNYRSALRKKLPERILYLAVSFDIYDDFFQSSFIQEIIAEHQVKLLVFEPQKEEIVLWIK
ncbi:MAG TPA: fatty-acid oxidation protein subunit alpha [Cyanobacteria bacterium UBA11149]|nr:fatty-acid oxidation protein subunit alpha [Cyanobacteria bacterium UBA11367]HBE56337.1 fatty-acid oxidation protein subunit alpha [Cyanobacteria bacterium UBA11366]HBK65949.1 fatty-acid oxidation protein subunit alpha [Cyanobacteria bacterium UBA11166]HBR76260.1 fatty-acid oxidation protein subunit alpha [Cyanobacteria bacterium UBA11159]HBS70495.1 fatty-acid oxidation protein subunit alpha [Cyanobacteria bacterium UBA11153]HBW91851.1 fatty-acid oxidation protein subunit alpha [Cyanobacter